MAGTTGLEPAASAVTESSKELFDRAYRTQIGPESVGILDAVNFCCRQTAIVTDLNSSADRTATRLPTFRQLWPDANFHLWSSLICVGLE